MTPAPTIGGAMALCSTWKTALSNGLVSDRGLIQGGLSNAVTDKDGFHRPI
jgi:hypothetical protein